MSDAIRPDGNVDRYPGDDIPCQKTQQKLQESYSQQPLQHTQPFQTLSDPVTIQSNELNGCLRTVIVVSLLLLVLVIIIIIIGVLGR